MKIEVKLGSKENKKYRKKGGGGRGKFMEIVYRGKDESKRVLERWACGGKRVGGGGGRTSRRRYNRGKSRFDSWK